MSRRNRSEQEWDALARRRSALTILGRVSRPEDIADAVGFLAAPESGWITAQVPTVDGGRIHPAGSA